MKDNVKTKVKFLKDSEYIFAYFPELQHDENFNTCYAHIGQHSACCPSYADECETASQEESIELLNELNHIGYNLEVI